MTNTLSKTKLDKLTPEQQQALVQWREDWLRIGSSCEPADRPRAENAISAMYQRINAAQPQFVWCDSPATALLCMAVLRNNILLKDSLSDLLGNSLNDSLRDSLSDSLRNSLRSLLSDSLANSLWNSLRNSLWNSLRNSLWNSLRNSLEHSLWNSLNDSLRDSLSDSLRNSLRSLLSDSLANSLRGSLSASLSVSLWNSLHGSLQNKSEFCFWGAQESYWVSFYLFVEQVLGVTYARSADLNLWADLCQSCGWWYPYKNFCIVTERPELVRWSNDPRPVLHCVDGPALKYRDGWSVYCWRGTRVPAEWITNKNAVDPRLALTHENIEQRRALAEIIGWARVLEQLQPTIIDTDRDPQIGTLLEVDLPNSGRERFLRVKCGTGRDFVLPVPPTIRSALEANAWTYGLDGDQLKLEVRT